MSDLDYILAIEQAMKIVAKIRTQHDTSSFLWTYCYRVGVRMTERRDALVKDLLSAPKEFAA
jgi:hypothetical protein